MTDVRHRGHHIRFGITTPQMWRSSGELIELWLRAEAAGWDAAFVVDHFMSDWRGELGPNLEAFALLGGLARETTRIDVGVLVAGITHRPPMVLVKSAVTVDHLARGRFIFGVGAAWNEREHRAYGIPFPPPGERVSTVEETLEALRALEGQEATDFEGSHLSLDHAPFQPKPYRGRLPILIGSHRPRMLDVLARYGDYWDAPTRLDDLIAAGTFLDQACARRGRDPDEIVWVHEEIGRGEHATGEGLARRMATLAPIGVSTFLVNVWPGSDDSVIERLAEGFEALRTAYRPDSA